MRASWPRALQQSAFLLLAGVVALVASATDDQAASMPSAPARWTLVEFSVQPPAAVFKGDVDLRVVKPGDVVPGSPVRLVGLNLQGALLALAGKDGRELHVRLKRGESVEPDVLLSELAASEQTSYPPLELSEGGSDAE